MRSRSIPAIINHNMAVNFIGTLAMARGFAPVTAGDGRGVIVTILTFLCFVGPPDRRGDGTYLPMQGGGRAGRFAG